MKRKKKNPKHECLHQIGTMYYSLKFDTICMLACVDTNLVSLICLETGNRWSDPVRVINPKHNGVPHKIFKALYGDVDDMSFIHNDFLDFMKINNL